MNPLCEAAMKPDVSNGNTEASPEKKPMAAVGTRYGQLTETYDKIISSYLETVTFTSVGLVLQSKIPLITRNQSEKVFDETHQDSQYKKLVLETYLESIEDVQSGHEQVKRAIYNLPKYKVDILREWCANNYNSPYPTEKQKEEWSKQLEISVLQISQWFSNYRKRVWKPHHRFMNMH